MPRFLRFSLVSARDLAVSFGPFIVIAAVLLAGAYWLLDPMPPRKVVLATGPERSAYEEFGRRFAAELRQAGIDVELRRTAGARENLRLLREGKENVDLAFVQGGASESIRLADEKKRIEEPIELISFGSLFYEPYWLFYRVEAARRLPQFKAPRSDPVVTSVTDLRGWKVNTGVRGSGTPGLTNRLLAANLMDREDIQRTNLEDTQAVIALLAGEIDALALVSAPESPFVQMLLQTPGIRLKEFPQAEAYARRYGFVSAVTLPRGVADLSRDVPPHDVPLIAATTSLVAREGTHPAIGQLFVQAASRIHGGPGWISRAGQFPSPANSEFTLSKEAERFYRTGPPLLQRYLPFWTANLIDRMWVAIVSIIAILIPVSRLVPPLYAFRVRSRIFRWYRMLRAIEDDHEQHAKTTAELLADLDRVEARASRITVPLSYADELYALRTHIDLVRERLRGSAAPS